MSFWDKYSHTTKLHDSYVCVGLDSDIAKLPGLLEFEQNPILKFNEEIVRATRNKVACYKLNLAFYLAAGKTGYEALERTLGVMPSYIPVILDCKVGDIGNTMSAYAKAFLKEMPFDAITVNPLMGGDVLDPLAGFDQAMKFVLTLTSNPSSKDFLLRNNLYLDIAKWLEKRGHEQWGAVVGATNPKAIRSVRWILPKSLFLIPGVGVQGGDLEQVVQYATASAESPCFLVNSSRGIIFASRGDDFAEAALNATEDLRLAINNILDS
ncbi:MAG: orotidine-5'-phosphate decarboxylase [Candidatus Cloacimonetes bacterium]|nr:orotidine-5'-phosphate decarboxylase [Candidatus Cloacimonadota bacterium]